MSSVFMPEILKGVVSQICQVVGYHGIYSVPLNVLVDLLHKYLREVSTLTHRYSEHCGRTDPTIEDLGLAFRELGVSIPELEEYVHYVDAIPYPHSLPKFPVPRSSNLNFLKPGSREILSRPLHIHEHLPPMYPEKEDEELNIHVDSNGIDDDGASDGMSPSGSPLPVKRHTEHDGPNPKKIRYGAEEEGQPVREIDSVMMTTSGFISSAREGKVPEAKRPNIPMALPSMDSSSAGQALKKKATMEKIFRHKNQTHQGGILPGPLAHPSKDFKLKPKFPSAPPGTRPKLKIPTPIALSNEEKTVNNSSSSSGKIGEKKKKKDRESKNKEEGRHKEKKKVKEHRKEGKKDKEGKKEKESKKKEKIEKKDKRRDRPRIRVRGLSKEEELARYKAREKELIAALAASSAVTVTSIPPPHLRVREKTPEHDESKENPDGKRAISSPDYKRPGSSSPDSRKSMSPSESKSKLSIFKKVGKVKEGDKVAQSRESSPNLMIDDSKIDERKTFEESSYQSPSRSVILPENLILPKTPDISVQPPVSKGRPRGKKVKDKESKSKKIRNQSSPRGRKPKNSSQKLVTPPKKNDYPSFSNEEFFERPKTPAATINEELPDTPTNFPLPFPNNPSFIPPFSSIPYSRFPFIPPFVEGSPRPSVPDLQSFPPLYMGAPPGESKDSVEYSDSVKLPLTPQHNHEFPAFSPLHDTSSSKGTSSIDAFKQMDKEVIPKLEKTDKKEKKDHKKEKKDKEKEKEKSKKKKDKKDKVKAKEEKKKEKERLKLEKKEKKRGRKKKEDSNSLPKLTLKIQSDEKDSSINQEEVKSTPKLVIRPVVKHAEENVSERLPPSPISSMDASISLKSLSPPPKSIHDEEPEIAKFSALITRPPKSKSHSKKSHQEAPLVPPLKLKDHGSKMMKDPSTPLSWNKESRDSSSSAPTESVPKLKIKNNLQVSHSSDMRKPQSNRGEKKEKRKKSSIVIASETDLGGGMLSPIVSGHSDSTPSKSSRKMHMGATSTPVSVMPVSSTPKPSTTPGGITEDGPIGHFIDDQGNEVWICPTCGKQDDGSPMIGCDTCDDWYHWVCVGIQVPPSEHENWYCPRCLSQHKQRGGIIEKKKRGRKRKII